jgi:hypothetical protein
MPSAGGSVDQLITQSSWRLLRQPLFLMPVRTRSRIDLSYKNLCLEVKDNMKQVFVEYESRENRRKQNAQ